MKKIYLLAALCLVAACNPQESFSPDENAGVQLAHRVSIFESKGSQKQWVLTAQAVDFADLTTATLKNPELLLKQNGQDSARVSGQSGIFDYTRKLITIEGNAQIMALTEDAVITTERFFYDINQDRVWSDHKTLVTRQTSKAVAQGGIETDSKLTKIELKKQTTQVSKDARELKKTL